MAQPQVNPKAAIDAVGKLLKVGLFGVGSYYLGTNCLFNVEGGHRAVVFNRLSGIKETVSVHRAALPSSGDRGAFPHMRAFRSRMCGFQPFIPLKWIS